MAKREEEIKKKEALEDLDLTSEMPALTKSNVEFALQKKKKLRKKMRKSKSAIGPSRAQFSRSYVFDSKRDKDKASVKVCESLSDNAGSSTLIFDFSSPTSRQQRTPPNSVKRRPTVNSCRSRQPRFIPSTDRI